MCLPLTHTERGLFNIVVDFSKIDLREQPVLILKNSSGKPIGTLGYALDISLDIKYNETSVLEFSIPERVDGVSIPYYDSVIGMRIVEIEDIGQFILINPSEIGDGVKKVKSCKGYSLEYEFTFKKITLENATYNFWNPTAPGGTLLGAILELMPSWRVGTVDSSLIGKYRTFEVADTNLYNFIKSTVQQSYNCIFDFDTKTRTVNVKDVMSAVVTNPIYISNANLAKEIEVTENTENIVTRLDVNGAEGITIRDVNPTGTNTLVNLDYFMTSDNFDQDVIDRYYEWKNVCKEYKLPYYNLSIEYSLRVACRTAETAAMVDLQGELTSLENQQAVIIQAIAQSLEGQDALDEINASISEKQTDISSKQTYINTIQEQIDSIYGQLKEINLATKFESYFTDDELLVLDRYIKDDSISESSFVTKATGSYADDDIGNVVKTDNFAFSDAAITLVHTTSGKAIYDVKAGKITSEKLTADVVSAAFETSEDGKAVMSVYLGAGEIDGRTFVGACLSVTGNASDIVHDLVSEEELSDMLNGTSLSFIMSNGYMYFTYDTSEYEKRSVAWELYEYGENVLEKISQPSYQFGVSSANFLCLDDFVDFKNSLRHGEKIYIGISEDETLSPICIGLQMSYGAINDLTLEFGDTYTSSDSSFLLADLLEQSVSMGKSVDLSKYTYSAFVDSGASTKVKDFMSSSLDVSRNAIMSSKDQAITWGESGIRLRKWTDETHTIYDPKQVWMNNNSILMTSNNWSTAEIAIGNFHDSNMGDCWGIVAPNIVGTLLAGENLVIESKKKDGDTSVFKVDADGCILYNSQFDIVSGNKKTHITLDPQLGIAIGEYPVYSEIETRSTISAKTIDEDKAKFWVDTDGNLYFKGTLRATTGEFSGKVTAKEGYIGNGSEGWTIGNTYIYNGKSALLSAAEGVYIGTDGISLGNGTSYVRATSKGVLTANDAVITGDITAKSGTIGGFTIGDNSITTNDMTWDGSQKTGVYIGTNGIRLGSNFGVDSSGNLYAASGTFTGTVYAGNIEYGGNKGTLNGSGITDSTITGGKVSSNTITGGKLVNNTITADKLAEAVKKILGMAEDAYGALWGDMRAGDIACDQLSADDMLLDGKRLSNTTIRYTNSDGGTSTMNVVTWSTGGSYS